MERMAPDNTCECLVCLDVKRTINDIFSVLSIYGWLLDTYIIDFYHDDLWSRLPSVWTETLENVSPEEMGSWILGELNVTQRVWPLSLLALRQLINILSINRDWKKKSRLICSKSTSKLQNIYDDNELICLDKKNNDNLKLKKLFNKHVKEKKRYEIEIFSKYCSKISYLNNCCCIVDTGAGIGHLARELSCKYNLKVICIEQEKSLSDLAKKYDDNFIQMLRKYLPDFCGQTPYHYCTKIVDESCTGSELSDKFNDIIMKNFTFDCKDENKNEFGLIGLHPCGDLAARLLKLFVNQVNAKFICVIGCCYMKLTTSGKVQNNKIGYPLSKFISGKSENSLSYEALEVACHAIENYCDKLKNGNYHDLKVHAFRSSLEDIFMRKGAHLATGHGRVGNVKVKNQMEFAEYCKLATMPLGPEKQLNDADIDSEMVRKNLGRWKRVVIFESLRMMLAPLIETLVLLDRFLFLSEHGMKPMLRAIFDPRISSRNFLITSIK